jgi:hypothetical protein
MYYNVLRYVTWLWKKAKYSTYIFLKSFLLELPFWIVMKHAFTETTVGE